MVCQLNVNIEIIRVQFESVVNVYWQDSYDIMSGSADITPCVVIWHKSK